jgi:hypothetical protein
MKHVVFWDVAPCSSFVNRRFGGTYRHQLEGRKIRERGTSVSRWLQTEVADFSSLKMEAIFPPKRLFTQELHGSTSQKTALFTKKLSQGGRSWCRGMKLGPRKHKTGAHLSRQRHFVLQLKSRRACRLNRAQLFPSTYGTSQLNFISK